QVRRLVAKAAELMMKRAEDTAAAPALEDNRGHDRAQNHRRRRNQRGFAKRHLTPSAASGNLPLAVVLFEVAADILPGLVVGHDLERVYGQRSRLDLLDTVGRGGQPFLGLG